MKRLLHLLPAILFFNSAVAQTWNGSTGSNWNVAANWTPANVPGWASTVIIPNTANKPVLDSSISITGFTMNAGSAINFNGFALTVNNGFDCNGATLNNSSAATDIIITLNGAGVKYIRQSTVNDNLTVNYAGPGNFYEAYLSPNTFNGSVTFNISSTGPFHLCYDDRSSFNGNVTINRTVAGLSYIFKYGAVAVNGNFSYTNTAGGNTYIHQNGLQLVPITGSININLNGAGTPVFSMERVMNQTGGGTISVQNSGQVTIQYDTLIVNAFNINGFSGSLIDDFNQNSITGNVNISDAATNGGATYLRRSTHNGSTIFTQNSGAIFYEAYQGGNVYNGNLTLVRNAGQLNIAYANSTVINQNLTFNTSAGLIFSDTIKFGGSSNTVIDQLGTEPLNLFTIQVLKTGAGSVTLADSLSIVQKVIFTSGNIYTTAVNRLKFNDNSTHTGASLSSHVIGPVNRTGDDAFTFPVGGPVSYNPISMSPPADNAHQFQAEYKMQNPTSDGYNTNNKAGSFGAAGISKAGYWDVKRLSGTGNVTLTAGFGTNPYEQYPSLAALKLGHWNGAQWDDHGNGGTTGTAASGTIINAVPFTGYGPFALAGITSTYFYVYSNPGPGPDGTPLKFTATGGYPPYNTKQLPAGSYSADSTYLVPNGTSPGFKLKDLYGVEKDDTTVTTVAAPTQYITANGYGSINFSGFRNFVYLQGAGNQIMGAVKDNGLTLGNTTMTTYFSTPAVATSPNGNTYLRRSFKISSEFAPVGTRRVRFYITKTEFNNLAAADPVAFPGGINSITITKYSGATEDSLFNPIPGGNTVIIPNSAITIADMGTMYSLDIDVTGFSGFYIGGNNSNFNTCTGSTFSLPSNISGATYQWQVDNGSGFVNLSNNSTYGGVTTSSLTVTNAPNSLYGYKFRAVVNGGVFSQEYTVKFTASWEGTVSNVWENPANWSCGNLPDNQTDVVINAGKPNYPQLGINLDVRTIKVNPGASVTVKTGATLRIHK